MKEIVQPLYLGKKKEVIELIMKAKLQIYQCGRLPLSNFFYSICKLVHDYNFLTHGKPHLACM